MPALPPRMRAPTQQPQAIENTTEIDVDTVFSESSDETEDDTTSVVEEDEAAEQDTTVAAETEDTEDATTMSSEAYNEATEDDTEQVDDDTEEVDEETMDDTEPVELPPYCSHGRCHNRAARDCENLCCGRCCQLHGQYSCSRHNC